MKKFTVWGSEKLEKKIREDQKLILATLQDNIDFSTIKAIILGGGYGRGEGGVFIEDGNEKLFNDYDYFVFTKNQKNRTSLHRSIQPISHKLTEKIGIDVDFSYPYPISILPKVPFYLFWLDLKFGYYTLYGKENLLQAMPNFKYEELPAMEAAKLLLNRGTGLLLAENRINSERITSNEENEFIYRNLMKAVMACGDAYLIIHNIYHPSYLNRKELILQLKKEVEKIHEGFSKNYTDAIDYKLKPIQMQFTRTEWEKLFSQIKSIYRKFYLLTFGSIAGKTFADFDEYLSWISRYYPTDSYSQILKNILLNTKYDFFRSKDYSKYVHYPRYKLFFALPYLLFNKEIDQSIKKVFPIMNRNELISQYMKLWDRFN